jgi:Big-like domain-containing protein
MARKGRRRTRPLLVLTVVSGLVGLLAGSNLAGAGILGAAHAATPTETRSQVFGFTGTVQTFTVPEGVRQLEVSVAGGHGQWTERTAKGGPGGFVTGRVTVEPGDVLDVYVGGYGGNHDGWGFGHGGAGGGSPSYAHDGKRGGGGSALLAEDESPLLVAGGGGGGGGDGGRDGYYGGRGGEGGRPAGAGEDANHDEGGDGGDAGCEGCRGIDGQGGDDAEYSGGGGGGGGGYAGGGGGHDSGGLAPGGGGGGGGLSYAAPSARIVKYGIVDSVGDRADGSVRIAWTPDTPSAVAVYGDSSGQQAEVGSAFGRGLQARVTAADGDPVAHASVRFAAPASGATATFGGGAHEVTVTADANGVATAPPLTAGLEAGAWTATASAAGVSGHASFSLVNQAAETTMALSPSAQPAVFGQPAAYTAYVTAAPIAGTPRGTVSFTVDGAPLGGPVALADGVATSASIAILRPGTHKVEATYSPSTSTWAPASASATQTVEPALTTLDLTSSDNPTEIGHALFFNAAVAAVAPGGGAPDGKVAFSVEGKPLETVDLVDGEARTSSGFSSLVSGNFQVFATYLPAGDPADPANLPRYVTTAASLGQAVGPGTTATTVTSSAEPAVAGQPVTLTATVQGGDVLGPTGTVTFTLDGTEICRNVPLAQSAGYARAPCPIDPQLLSIGEHQVLARYSGNPGQSLQPSSGGLTQRVGRASVAIELLSEPDPTAFGQPITMSAALTAVDPGTGTPTGTVQFFADGRPIGLPRPLDSTGKAQLGLLGELAAGPLSISARYSGDGRFLAEEASETHTVGRGGTAVTVTPSADPAPPGSSVTFAAHVAALAPAFGNPRGQLQFRLDGEPLGEPVEVDPEGDAVSPPVADLGLGEHDLTASYAGDRDFQAGQAVLTQRVAPAAGPSARAGDAGGGSSSSSPACRAVPALTRLAPHAGRVRVAGIVAAELAGQPATISARGRVVARSTVGADGTFAADAPLPHGNGWRATRYRAKVGGVSSGAVPLVQALRLGYRWQTISGGLRVQVQLDRGGDGPAKLTLRRSLGCASPETVARAQRTGRGGRTTLYLAPPPAAGGPAVYQVSAGRQSSLAIAVSPEGQR